MVPQNFYEQRARDVIAIMNSMLRYELDKMAILKSEGALAPLPDDGSREVRLIIGSVTGSQELIVRPHRVFGNMAGTDLSQVGLQQLDEYRQIAFRHILSSMTTQANNTLLATAIKMIEPECTTLGQSKIMRNFALVAAAYFVSPRL